MQVIWWSVVLEKSLAAMGKVVSAFFTTFSVGKEQVSVVKHYLITRRVKLCIGGRDA